MSTIVMLDLENTLIDSWSSPEALPQKVAWIHDKLSEVASPLDSDFIGIFSFAVSNKDEKDKALEMAKSAFDGLDLSISFTDSKKFIVSFDEVEKSLEKFFKFKSDVLETWEIINLFGKEACFEAWSAQFPQFDFILFDDALKFDTKEVRRTLGQHQQNLTFIRV